METRLNRNGEERSGTSNVTRRNTGHLQNGHYGTSRNRADSGNGVSGGGDNDLQENGTRHGAKTFFGARLQDIFHSSEIDAFELFFVVRVASVLAWTGSVLYATYHVFLACEEHLDVWYKDPVMNPGPLSRLLDRGRDSTDYEWEMFTTLFANQLWFWYGGYALCTRTIQLEYPQKWNFISTGISLLMFWSVIGILPTIFIVLQPVIYWMIAQTRSKLLAWTVTVLFIYQLNSPVVEIFIPGNAFSEYFFVITAAWNCARCISFCYDVWEQTESIGKVGSQYLMNGIHYCLYLPLAISGPLVTYESFEKNIIKKRVEEFRQRNTAADCLNLFKQFLRMGLNIIVIELILHSLYFRALSMVTPVHRYLSLWAVCGTIYWLGQFFSMKYKVLYGVPTYIAEFDGMEMPPLPKCPSYLHRYSVLWRDFDRGLYRFLVKYIYLPTLTFVRRTDTNNRIPSDIQKLIASFMSFVYVYIWHSLSFDVFVWTVLNFLGITIERIGSVIKREIDKRAPIQPIVWDFWIEPIVTIPLAAMSILNSSIFCGSMESAISFSSELWRRRQDNWVFFILYFFTHTAVTCRTWGPKLYNLLLTITRRH